MTIDLVTRREWGARDPFGTITTIRQTLGVKIHYTGGRVNPNTLDDHDLCTTAVKGIQNGHMSGNGWLDIGYSMVACPHRKVFVGRGPYKLPSANGPGLNSGHYAILGLVGNAGLIVPTDDMLLGILDTIEYLRENGGAGKEIKGHRDGYSTDCPGEHLYSWVRRGAPRPGGTTPEPPVNTAPKWPGRYFEYERGQELIHGADVETWQRQVAHRGWDLDIDGWYGEQSEAVCRAFQREKGLWVDGIVGSKTWTAAWTAPIT